MEKYKVFNDRSYNIGMVLANGVERVVKPGSYTLLSKDEIEHVASIAPKLFLGERQLRFEDRKLAVDMGFIADENAPLFDTAEIRKHLSGSIAKMKAWLETVTEPFLLDEVLTVARTMDLPASKLQVLQDKFPGQTLIESADS